MAIRISTADIGSRVTLRARLADAGEGPSMTDTVGRLVAWEDGVLVVERRDGTRAEVVEADLVAAKVIPEPPPRARARYPAT